MNINRFGKQLQLAAAITLAASLTACTTIQLPDQATSVGKEAKMNLSLDGDARQFRLAGDLKISKVTIQAPTWPTGGAVATDEEQRDVINMFKSQLMAAVKPATTNDGQPILVRAVITDGRTVSPALNMLTTFLAFVPLDRGGAVIELEAVDPSGKVVASMLYRYSGEISEFLSNFSKTAQINVATQRASDRFAKLLAGQ